MAGTPDGHPTPDPPAADPLSNTDAEGKKLTIDNASVPTLYQTFREPFTRPIIIIKARGHGHLSSK